MGTGGSSPGIDKFFCRIEMIENGAFPVNLVRKDLTPCSLSPFQPYTPTSSPGHLRSGFPWPASPCSSCGNQMLHQIHKTPVSKRHSAHFPIQETPAKIREEVSMTMEQQQHSFLEDQLQQNPNVDALTVENQELR